MAYSTIVSLEKLTCTDYIDFEKCYEKGGQLSSTKKIPTTYM